MNRLKLKGEKRKNKKLIILVLLILISLTGYFLIIINNHLFLFMQNYAQAKVKNVILYAIDKSVNEKTISYLNYEDLYYIERDKNDNISIIDYNSRNVNMFLGDVTTAIEETMNELEKDIIFNIPLGVITNNTLFNNLGPKIPVRIQLIGYVNTNIETKVKDYGINNALIEMSILVEASVDVILPFITDTIKVSNNIPVSYKIIQGKIPDYYSRGFSKTSELFSLSTP